MGCGASKSAAEDIVAPPAAAKAPPPLPANSPSDIYSVPEPTIDCAEPASTDASAAVDANVAEGCPIESFTAAQEDGPPRQNVEAKVSHLQPGWVQSDWLSSPEDGPGQPDPGGAPALEAKVEALHGGSVNWLDASDSRENQPPPQEELVASEPQVARPPGDLGGTGDGAAGAFEPEPAPEPSHATATFAMGCFWGAEAVMGGADGVIATRVGYIDGCEVVQCRYSGEATTFDALLQVWAKGHSVGRQWASKKYASAVLLGPGQRARARAVAAAFGATGFEPVRGLGDFIPAKEVDQMYEFRKKQPKLFTAQYARLTPQQLTKLNSCIGLDMPHERWLSPIDGDDSLGVDFDSDTKPGRRDKQKGAGPAKKKPISRIKILLLGDEGVGKTELIRRATGEVWDAGGRTDPTAGIPKPVMHELETPEGEKVTLQLWDRSGGKNGMIKPALRSFYRGAMAALLVYDISRTETLESVPRWLAELQGHRPAGTKIPVVLVANKGDLESANSFAAEVCEVRSAAFLRAGHFVEHVSASSLDSADTASSLAAVKACVRSVLSGDFIFPGPEKIGVGAPIDPGAVGVAAAPPPSWRKSRAVGGEAAIDEAGAPAGDTALVTSEAESPGASCPISFQKANGATTKDDAPPAVPAAGDTVSTSSSEGDGAAGSLIETSGSPPSKTATAPSKPGLTWGSSNSTAVGLLAARAKAKFTCVPAYVTARNRMRTGLRLLELDSNPVARWSIAAQRLAWASSLNKRLGADGPVRPYLPFDLFESVKEQLPQSSPPNCNLRVAADQVSAAGGPCDMKLVLERSLQPYVSFGNFVKPLLPSVQELVVRHNRLAGPGLRALLYAMASNKTVKTLDVAGNTGDPSCCDALQNLFTLNKTLTSIDVSDNALSTNFAQTAAVGLRRNQTMKCIQARSVGMLDATGLWTVLTGLKQSALRVLDISQNPCNPNSFAVCSAALRSGACLYDLQLAGVELGDVGAVELAAGVKKIRTLTALDVSSASGLSVAGIIALLDGCTQSAGKIKKLKMTSLKVVSAAAGSSSPPTSPGPAASTDLECDLSSAAALGESFAALMRRGELIELHLESTNLPSAACLPLMKAMVENRKLSVLNLSNNKLPPECANQLGESLRTAKTRLHTLLYDCNSINGFFEKVEHTLEKAGTSSPEMDFAWLPTHLDFARALYWRGGSIVAELDCIGQAIGNSRLSELRLSGNTLDPEKLVRILDPAMTRLQSTQTLKSLNLSKCSIGDDGVFLLADAISAGLTIHDLDLSMNGIGDNGVGILSGAMQRTSCVRVLKLMQNNIGDLGARALAVAIGQTGSQLSDLVLSSNVIGSAGFAALCAMADSPNLQNLDLSSQQEGLMEIRSMEQAVFNLQDSIGRRPADKPLANVSMMGYIGRGRQQSSINISELVRPLDCATIRTDFAISQRLPGLCLQDMLDFATVLQDRPLRPVEFVAITGPGSPSWLKVPELRRRGVFISHLSAHVTVGKLENTLMAEADCNITELCRVVDPIGGFTGQTWCLFDDEISVVRVLDLFNSGDANIYGTAFGVSTIQVALAGEEGAVTVAGRRQSQAQKSILSRTKAAADITKRVDERKAELLEYVAEIRELEAQRKTREDEQTGRDVAESGYF
jgi:small GTP-binding protein